MGNRLFCMSKKDVMGKEIGRSKSKGKSSSRFGSGRSQQRIMLPEEELLHKHALSVAIQQCQSQSQRFEGSMSRRIGPSTSSRRLPLDPIQITNLENIKFKKFILIHGEGFGAWCWYKTTALLEEVGLHAIALDLMGSGIDLTDSNSVTTLADYSEPLTNYLDNLPEDEKVILVGHGFGGACISYALEHYPKKISKAIFLCATMVSDGQKPFDVFAQELGSAELFMKGSKLLMYANGEDNSPTGFMLEKHHMRSLYFNQTPAKVYRVHMAFADFICNENKQHVSWKLPISSWQFALVLHSSIESYCGFFRSPSMKLLVAQDVALAMTLMRPIPLGPIMEKMLLSPENYGTGRRYFIQTLDDHALSPDVQEKLVRENPPEGVFKIKGSDHCPFLSKPQSLHKIFLEIARIP
ncbi:Alpha/beta hydrolase fold-1 [Dillenia turbinata]|uniref:Alpha/beta hydrolase fold-1 n=1 Tax=Dillenia turbinata TaxID=194707 RepID=A0AAN8ZL01_9MAGN